jgi:hypothetical protein
MYDEDLGPAPGAALVRECRKRLNELGDAPTKRLRPVAERSAVACTLLSAKGSYRRALDVVGDADDLVWPLFLDSQDLLLTDRVTNLSRADLRLSALASVRADKPVEVRCWSTADWRRVVGEDNAWTNDDNDPQELYGQQDEDASRIHMRLSQCNRLVRLRRADVLSARHVDQLELSDSLDTFTHEIQHFVHPDADEAEVECAAMPTVERIAMRLGASPDEAVLLARLQKTEVYPNLPDEYRAAGGCKA